MLFADWIPKLNKLYSCIFLLFSSISFLVSFSIFSLDVLASFSTISNCFFAFSKILLLRKNPIIVNTIIITERKANQNCNISFEFFIISFIELSSILNPTSKESFKFSILLLNLISLLVWNKFVYMFSLFLLVITILLKIALIDFS